MINALTSLNAGSGIDVKALTEELLNAERLPRQQQIDSRLERVEAQISAVGQFRSALSTMVSALDSRIAAGDLSGQPKVSDPSILSMSVAPGTILSTQSIEVMQLARGQSLASGIFADPAAAIGEGQITIRFGNVAGNDGAEAFTSSAIADLQITIDSDNNSLSGIRDAINEAAKAAGASVQAQLVADSGGTRLVLRGATGEASGFIVETAGDPALDAFRFGVGDNGGLQRTQTAADAIVALDGLAVHRPQNRITDLIPGATLDLVKAAPGQPVSLSAERSPTGLAETVQDLASALNELRSIGADLTRSTPGASGALSGNLAATRALQNLTGLTSVTLISGGDGPSRLSDIGISIDRSGKFIVDEARLAKVVAENPAAVEALVTALNRKASPGVAAGPLRQIAEQFDNNAASSQNNALTAAKTALQKQQQRLDDSMARKREVYTRQFAALDRAVNQSKALQSYMQQQIDMWTNSKN